MSVIPQGLYYWDLFDIFVSDMGSGIQCTLSKFAINTELCGAADTLEGRDAIQRGLGRLEMGLCNLYEVQQCQVQGPVYGSGQPTHKYRLERERIESSPDK